MNIKKFGICLGMIAMGLSAMAQEYTCRFSAEAEGDNAYETETESNGFKHPAGNLQVYRMSFGDQFYYQGGSYTEYKGAASNIVYNGDKEVWFYNLAPTSSFGWAKGERNGNEISVARQKIGEMALDNAGKNTCEVWLQTISVDDDGYIKLSKDPYKFVIKDDSVCSADTAIWLATFLVKDNKGTLFCLNRKYKMCEEGNTELNIVPEGIKEEPYVFRYVNEWLSTKYLLGSVARDGADVYMRGLVPDCPNTWIKGTLNEDATKLNITDGIQFLGSDTGLLLDYVGGELLDDGYSVTPCDVLSFDVSSDFNEMNVMPGGHVMVFNRATEDLQNMYSEMNITKYEGNKVSIPAAADKISVDNGYGDLISFRLPTRDVDDKYIDPEHITWRVFLDDKLYEFTPQEYTDLTETATELKYMLTTAYDFSYDKDYENQKFYIYDRDWDHIDIQSIYTVDGIRRESALSRYSIKKGFIGTTTGIGSVSYGNAVTRQTFGIDGMRRSMVGKGLSIVRTTDADGNVTVRKVAR